MFCDYQVPTDLYSTPRDMPWHSLCGVPPTAAARAASHQETTGISNGDDHCDSQCLESLNTLLEELETCMHDTDPCKVDSALSFQKRAYQQCSRVLLCKSCCIDSDALMILIMVCDKQVMLSKKILWYTKEVGSSEEQPLRVGDYGMDETSESAGVIQILSAVQLRNIKLLVEGIEKGLAVAEGKSAQLMVLRSVKQQVITLLQRIKEALAKHIFEAE